MVSESKLNLESHALRPKLLWEMWLWRTEESQRTLHADDDAAIV